MSIAPSDDRLHLPSAADDGLRDAVSFSWGDPAAELYGLARLSHGSDGAHGLAVLFARDRAVAASVAGAVATADRPPAWDSVAAGGVHVRVHAPLEAWTVSYEGRNASFELRFEACSAAAALDGESAVGRAGGMQGYEQLCRVSGSAAHGGRAHQVRCLGQRGQLWGNPDPSRVELTRTVSAWLGEDRAMTLATVRPAKSRGHFDEAVDGFMFEVGEPVAIAEPRLSTTYDGERRVRRAGLELWMDEEGERAHRMAGEVLCATSLDLGDRRLDSAVVSWRMEGREGVGRYDVLRRAGANGAARKRAR